jgi:uncharacterized protein
MKRAYEDKLYLSIVEHILENDKFNEIKISEHHGISRYDHSLRVSYISYKISKVLGLSYYEVARGGLLHDFFMTDNDRNMKDKVVSTFIHPKKAVDNAKNHFGLSKKEEDIIKTHMFPINVRPPKYMEGWVVNLVDKGVGIFEFSKKFSYKLKLATNLFVVFIMNSVK